MINKRINMNRNQTVIVYYAMQFTFRCVEKIFSLLYRTRYSLRRSTAIATSGDQRRKLPGGGRSTSLRPYRGAEGDRSRSSAAALPPSDDSTRRRRRTRKPHTYEGPRASSRTTAGTKSGATTTNHHHSAGPPPDATATRWGRDRARKTTPARSPRQRPVSRPSAHPDLVIPKSRHRGATAASVDILDGERKAE
jgi:hypothetical protein